VDRAWDCSFRWQKSDAQVGVFKSALKRLMEGHPIGSAIDFFNERYAELSSDLTMELEEIRFGAPVNELELCGLWMANNDARNYAVVGDPAVRLIFAETQADDVERPVIETMTFQPTQPVTEQKEPYFDKVLDFDKAQAHLTEALKQFIPLAAHKAEQLSTAASSAKGLLEDLKKL